MSTEIVTTTDPTETDGGMAQEPSRFITGETIRRCLKFGRGGVPFVKNLPVAPGIRVSARRDTVPGLECLGRPVHDGSVRVSWDSSHEVSAETFQAAVAHIHQSLPVEERAWISGCVPIYDRSSTERTRMVQPTLAEGVSCVCTYAIYQPLGDKKEKPIWRSSATFPIAALVEQSSRTDPRPFASMPDRGNGNRRVTGLSLQAVTAETNTGGRVSVYAADGYLIAIPPVITRQKDGSGNIMVRVDLPGHLLLIPGVGAPSNGEIDLVGDLLTVFEELASLFEAFDARDSAFNEEPIPGELVDAKDLVDEAQVELEKAQLALDAALKELRRLQAAREAQRLNWAEVAPYVAAALNRDQDEFMRGSSDEGSDPEEELDGAEELPGGDVDRDATSSDEAGDTTPPA